MSQLNLYLVNQDEAYVIFGKMVIVLTRCQIINTRPEKIFIFQARLKAINMTCVHHILVGSHTDHLTIKWSGPIPE